jgi:hypothetical protein
MGGRTSHRILAGLLTSVGALTAHAEVQETPNSLSSGQLALGAEFQAAPQPAPLSILLHQNVGLVGGLDLYAREGIPVSQPQAFYIGGGLKWSLLHEKGNYPSLGIWIGGHYWTDGVAGADITALLGHEFHYASPYGGLKYDLDFGNQYVAQKLRLLVGVRIPVVNHLSWYVEGAVGLVGEPRPHFLSTGPRFVM